MTLNAKFRINITQLCSFIACDNPRDGWVGSITPYECCAVKIRDWTKKFCFVWLGRFNNWWLRRQHPQKIESPQLGLPPPTRKPL